MDATIHRWDDVNPDSPVPLIHRQRIFGETMLMAMVRLEKGCHVATHKHESEQIAYIISGHVRWRLGEPGTPEYHEKECHGGEVVVLPSNFVHGVDAIEETHILDLLSPPGDMGIDSQRAH